MQTKVPIQPRLGEYNEEALQRLDLVLAEAARQGIRLILPFTNYEPFLGGIKWYAEQVHGQGADKELFYTTTAIREAYLAYARMIINRRNTVNGLLYKDDPTVLAWELMNEPHMRDNWEHARGLESGTIVRDWVRDMAAAIKAADANHMLFTGEEGYRTNGSAMQEQHRWIDNGLKGVDFAANCGDPNIDACTVHAYPDNWGFKPENYRDYAVFLQDRAQVAHSLGKPVLMEEYGMKQGFLSSREELLKFLLDEARTHRYACSLVWAIDTVDAEGGLYIFEYDEDGSEAVTEAYSREKLRGGGENGSSDTEDAVLAFSGPQQGERR